MRTKWWTVLRQQMLCSTRFWTHVTHTKTRYLQWYSNRSSVGDFRGFREHISSATKLLNILLISLIAVLIFLPTFVHHRCWVYSHCKLRITKLFFLIKSAQIFYFSKRKFTFQNVLFHFCTQNAHCHFTGFRENSELVTNLGQTLTVWRPLV